MQEIYWEAEQETRGRAFRAPCRSGTHGRGEEGKEDAGLSPPASSSFCLQDFGVCADSLCCLLSFGDAVLPKTPQLLQQMLFSLAQTLHVADKFRPAESHQRIQLGLSSQAGNSD